MQYFITLLLVQRGTRGSHRVDLYFIDNWGIFEKNFMSLKYSEAVAYSTSALYILNFELVHHAQMPDCMTCLIESGRISSPRL